MTLPTLILVLTAGLSAVAYPHPLIGRATSTDNPNGNTNNSAFIVAGAVVGTLFLIVTATSIHRMRRARQQARTALGRATTQTAAQAILSANPSTTNLSNAATPSNTNTGANANRRERRPRRNRRTPSQISTKSLPAYMEQPGDEELVLVQRATEPEMYSRSSSMDPGERSTYESRSSVDVQTPLMQEMHSMDDQDEGGDDDESRIPSRQGGHQVNMSIDSIGTGSADTHGSRNSATQLLTSADSTTGDVIDERGEVPPYTEQPAESTPPANNAAAGAHRSVASRIMPSMPSGLRNLFSGTRLHPHSHVENTDSSVPMVSVTEAPPANGQQAPSRRTRADTEVTVPDSGSLPALLLSRSRSPSSGRVALTRPLTATSSNTSLHARFTHQRNRSGSSLSPSVNNAEGSNANPPLNSPSSSSINISSPLVHTVTRTEFRFPKSGPTPDQLKFLSSRESLGRFGVPFGEDAERNYPSTLPPPFEVSPGASSSRHGSSHSSESTTGTEEAAPAPARQRPTSWWRNLTQPAGPHDPPKDVPVPETPAMPATPASAPDSGMAFANTKTASEVLPTSNEVPMGANEDEFEPATLVPLPPSARQSLVIHPSISLSFPPSHDDETEGSRRLSRAGTVSSAHTNVTYQTAADTVHLSSSSSSSSGTETEYYDGNEAAPSTPTVVPQRSLAAVPSLSIHENVDAPPATSAPMPPGTSVAAH